MTENAHVQNAEEAPACERPLAPLGLLAELTYRCPLQCPYCSNPIEMQRGGELTAAEWHRVFNEAADLGVLQVHLSGGEPCARKDLEEILSRAVDAGLYTNLITSGVTLTRDRLAGLAARGLDHVQISIQDTDPAKADWISGYKGGVPKKREVARWVRELGLPLTVNVVVHRHNIDNLPALIDYAVEVGAGRIEIANTQYYAWALKNRAALIPTREQFYRSLEIAKEARERLKGVLVFDVVAHDHYAVRPKPCMGGWGRNLIDITPTGKVLPCHAAETLPGLEIETVRDRPLAGIWLDGPAFQKYRGTSWMKEPCRSCNRCEIDWGGCRCQALAVTGDAANADPACALSPWHETFAEIAERESNAPAPPFIYRRMSPSSAI
ncbi:pyrroloquinoline quinone biosynthesis protein PqqE [Hyphomicrobium sp. LHD-15]|uniref:pyrroloquinoline quinone biosynthesis protein PqqE n=1 Tax=Hyphomicrobium sp. LHD-15 TaxID=3072142 RepID=UPI00280D0624|nr:pyrroloquinoline quinone biosynthesis protein PqqE [Hyphomicrobium sp. LHD-15]MDQ8699595.1 pyrroloquinoline quinone biosynthesis protein PqqE [Hyphomicrobium sp. LHD-15]